VDVRLPQETVYRILHCLVEGNSIRGTAHLCDVEKRTVLNILTLAGEACQRLFTERVRGVKVADLGLDEIWTYVGKHQKCIIPGESSRYIGDAYTFIGLERTSKLVIGWRTSHQRRGRRVTAALMPIKSTTVSCA
jgi:hypothetical protein